MTMPRVALGLDLGGSAVKWGLVDETGASLHDERIELEDRSPDAVVAILSDVIHRAKNLSPSPVIGIGIGSPGLIDKTQKIVRTPPNFPLWDNVPLADILQNVAGDIPVLLENDANVVVYAEHRWGAAQNHDNFMVLTLGTGVGGGVLVNGSLLRGHGGGGAELGHIQLHPDGPICGCGAHGCLEVYCNIRGVMRAARQVYRADKVPASPAALSKLAAEGSVEALEVWEIVGEWLGRGLAIFLNIFNPSLILIGGGISGAGEVLLEPARNTMKAIAYKANVSDVTVQRANLGEKAGLTGAAAMVFELFPG